MINIFEKSWIFFPFLWTGIQLQLLGLPAGPYSTCLSWLDEKKKRNKIPHFFDFFRQFFAKIFVLSVFFRILTLNIINLFEHARHFVLSSAGAKSQPFGRKSKKIAKIVKNCDFLEKVDFCDFWLLRIF